MDYSEQLAHPKWQRKRLEILERDNFTCTLCGDTETTLHIHHEKYGKFAWSVNNKYLKTRCSHCHLLEEYYKKHYTLSTNTFIKISKRDSVDNYIVLYVYRKNNHNINLLDIFCINKSKPPTELSITTIFCEKDIYNFIDFINSLNLPNG